MPTRAPAGTSNETSCRTGGSLGVGEGDVAEGHRPGGPVQRPGVGPLGHVRRLVEQGEGPLGAGQVATAGRPPSCSASPAAPYSCDRYAITSSSSPRVRAPAWTWRTPMNRTAAVPTAVVRPTSRPKPPSISEQAEPGPHPLAAAADEPLLLAVLLPERLDHPEGRQHLLDHRQGRALQLLHLPRLLPQPRPVDAGEQEQDRGDRQGDQGQLPVERGRCTYDHRRPG